MPAWSQLSLLPTGCEPWSSLAVVSCDAYLRLAHRATSIRVDLRCHFALLVAHLVSFRQSRLESSLEHPCCPYARTWLYSVKSLLPSSRRPDDAPGHQTTALVQPDG